MIASYNRSGRASWTSKTPEPCTFQVPAVVRDVVEMKQLCSEGRLYGADQNYRATHPDQMNRFRFSTREMNRKARHNESAALY